MDLPVLISVEPETFDRVFSFLWSPGGIFLLFLVVLVFALVVFWFLSRREVRKRVRIKKEFDDGGRVGVSESPEVKRLHEREEKIKRRES